LNDNGACDGALSAYSACISSGTGGSGGGTGGSGGGFGGTGGGFGGTGGGFGGTGGTGTCQPTAVGGTCTDVDQGDACSACMISNCCTPITTCLNTNDCAGLWECIGANCSTASDPNTCIQQTCGACLTQTGVDTYNAMGQCLQDYCTTDCA
jgi:hypothetical protein